MSRHISGLICLFSLTILQLVNVASKCHNGSTMANISLATKTPYRFVANRDDSPPAYTDCSPVKFWSMIRHGTRNPSDDIIRGMNERLPYLRDEIIRNHKKGIEGHLCDDVVRQLSKWTPGLNESQEKMLTHEGEDELLELGERFQKRFPELLPEIYSNSSFKFQFTATQRTEQSARSFATGLFGRRVSQHVWFPEPVYRDPILRFYKLCDRWRKTVDKNPQAYIQQRHFAEGSEMLEVQKEVTLRLGLKENISVDDVTLIYTTCSFETAWFPRKRSPWCALLSDYEFSVLEYAEDLDNYWIDGYGYEINYKQACPTIKDMFTFFSSTNSERKAVLYFSHAGTILKMLAHLGLYKDPEPLVASNFHQMDKMRYWRLSRISSFASNIAFVLYRCHEATSPELKILTLHQEQPVHLPGCPTDEDLCDLEEFQNIFSSSIQDCSFQPMCSLNN